MRVETEGDGTVTRLATGRLTVPTTGPGFTDITTPLREWVREIDASDGLLSAFVAHTTASLVIQENADANVRRDLIDAFDRLAPVRRDYRHGLEGADDMPAHIKASLTGISVVLPVWGGALALGTWQALYLVEHRSRPQRRTVRLNFIGR